MHKLLHKKYYNIGKSEKYLVQMWSQTNSSGIILLEVHGVSKNLDPNNPTRETEYYTLKRKQSFTRKTKDRLGKSRNEEKEVSH